MYSSHPIYLPAATVQPGNTSYRAVSPVGSEDEIKDDSSDLDMDEVEYAAKIAREIGLGLPTDAEEASMVNPVLIPKPQSIRDERDQQLKSQAFLAQKLASLTQADRFRATNLYRPPAPVSHPTVSAFPLTGPSMPPPPPPLPSSSAGAGNQNHWALHVRHYALPAEPPMRSVAVPAGWERVDALLTREAEADRVLANSARGRPAGGGEDTVRNSVVTIQPGR